MGPFVLLAFGVTRAGHAFPVKGVTKGAVLRRRHGRALGRRAGLPCRTSVLADGVVGSGGGTAEAAMRASLSLSLTTMEPALSTHGVGLAGTVRRGSGFSGTASVTEQSPVLADIAREAGASEGRHLALSRQGATALAEADFPETSKDKETKAQIRRAKTREKKLAVRPYYAHEYLTL